MLAILLVRFTNTPNSTPEKRGETPPIDYVRIFGHNEVVQFWIISCIFVYVVSISK